METLTRQRERAGAIAPALRFLSGQFVFFQVRLVLLGEVGVFLPGGTKGFVGVHIVVMQIHNAAGDVAAVVADIIQYHQTCHHLKIEFNRAIADINNAKKGIILSNQYLLVATLFSLRSISICLVFSGK